TSNACRTPSGSRPGPRSRAERRMTVVAERVGEWGTVRRLAGALHRRPRLRLTLLLTAPLLWLAVLYLGSLAVLFVSAFWTTNSFTSEVVKVWSTDNFRELFTTPVFRQVILRSVAVALAVTALCAVIA